jgi:hypothetical protein
VSATRFFFERAGRVGMALCLLPLVSAAAAEQRVLFPTPLHITRELSNPVSETKTTVDEYAIGNRLVSISGRRTAIADYEKSELTVIDFEQGTYSLTKFEQIAKLNDRTGARRLAATTESERTNAWQVQPRGGRVVASRPGELIEAERKGDDGRAQRVRVTADRQLTINRAAAEALLGFGYPNPRNDASDAVLTALRVKQERGAATANAAADGEYHFPLEYHIAVEFDGQTVETRNVVLRVGAELPPPHLLTIPPGAKLVESEIVATWRLLDELDRPPQ